MFNNSYKKRQAIEENIFTTLTTYTVYGYKTTNKHIFNLTTKVWSKEHTKTSKCRNAARHTEQLLFHLYTHVFLNCSALSWLSHCNISQIYEVTCMLTAIL